ncbi:MAG: hypothetical protein ACOX5J_11550 [Candidatus Hydrogenedentales bacterium]
MYSLSLIIAAGLSAAGAETVPFYADKLDLTLLSRRIRRAPSHRICCRTGKYGASMSVPVSSGWRTAALS